MTGDLFASEREAVVAEANRAPSVHNVQPVRWAFEPSLVRLRLDSARGLPVGDPKGVDAAFSLGCALEGTRIALARRGLGSEVEFGADEVGATATLRLRPSILAERKSAERDHERMERRRTHRLGFAVASNDDREALWDWADRRPDVALAVEPDTIGELATLNDAASLRFFRDDAYRAELVRWMRLDRRAPGAIRDGLSAASLGMGGLVAKLAGLALSGRMFPLLDRLGLSGGMVSERKATIGSAGIAAVTMDSSSDRPRADAEAGAAFLRATLELVGLGHQTWPMGVLVDDDEARERTKHLLELPRDREPRIVFRIGRPKGVAAPAARLPASELID